MAVYKRGEVWWYRFQWDGREIRLSSKQGNKRVAEQIEAAHKTRLAKGEVGIANRRPTPTLAEFIEKEFLPFVETTSAEKPKTIVFYRNSAQNLLKFKKLATLPLDEISGDVIAEYAAHRQSCNLQVATVNRELATLRRILSLCAEWGRTEKRLAKVRLLPGENHRDRTLSSKEETAYLAAAVEMAERHQREYAAALLGIRATLRDQQPKKPDAFLLRDVFLVLLDCGLRPEECYRLRWEQIQSGIIHILSGKTKNARRRVPLSQRAAAALEMRRAWVESEWVFPAPTTTGHIDVSTLKKQHAQAIESAGVKHFVFYSLRHTCLSRWAASLDPFKLKTIAGHGSIVTTQRYVHVNDEELFAAVEKARSGHKIRHKEEIEQKERPTEAGLLH
ncbi:MAG: site-specific integrase [Acidobacteria bacterium]|nr:site-specific integrase [Acidobacteriota bacterium]